MSLLWVNAAKRDFSALDEHIDNDLHMLPLLMGMRMDSPDLGEDAEFDAAHEHAGTCPTCKPKFKMLDLKSGTIRGSKSHTFSPERLKELVRSPNKDNLPEILALWGEHHVLDGHHRILSHMLRADRQAPVLFHDHLNHSGE